MAEGSLALISPASIRSSEICRIAASPDGPLSGSSPLTVNSRVCPSPMLFDEALWMLGGRLVFSIGAAVTVMLRSATSTRFGSSASGFRGEFAGAGGAGHDGSFAQAGVESDGLLQLGVVESFERLLGGRWWGRGRRSVGVNCGVGLCWLGESLAAAWRCEDVRGVGVWP